MTRLLLFAVCCFLLAALLPQGALAQGYNGVMQAQPNYRAPAAAAPAQQGDGNGAPVEDYSNRIDQGYGTSDGSYDQLLQSQDPAAAKNSATALQDKIRAKREAMVRAMKANSERLIGQEKQRAWQQSHPGQKYTGQNGDDPDSYVDDGSANYNTGYDAEPVEGDDAGADVGPASGDGGDSGDVGGGGMEGNVVDDSGTDSGGE